MIRSPPSILFVDDDTTLLEGIRRSLNAYRGRWDMAFCPDPEDAIDIFENTRVDVVIADIHMPLMDGLDMVRKMMAADRQGRARFMFLTGGGDFDAALRAINELHVYRFLQKPIVRDLLVEALKEAIEDIEAEEAVGGRHAAAALELINAAVLVMTPDARLLFANPAGRRLLDAPSGLAIGHDGVCRAATPDETRELHGMISACADDPANHVRWLCLAPEQWGQTLSLVAIPRGGEGSDRSVVLLSTDADAPMAMSEEALQHLFGLSPAEAAITLAIARGDRIEEAAEASGVTLSSARTYLKRVFLKTGVSRQSDLVKKVLTSPAALVKKAE